MKNFALEWKDYIKLKEIPYKDFATTLFTHGKAYCLEKVDSGDSDVGGESRFLYSGKLDSRMKGFDYVREILSTCRGFLYYCDGKIKVRMNLQLKIVISSWNFEV